MPARNAVAAAIGALIATLVSTNAWADHDHGPPVRLSIDAPNSGHFEGLTTPTGWSLIVRAEAPRSIAIVESPEEPTQPVGRREAIVLTDRDGCIDMRHFPIIRQGIPYQDCNGPDETFMEFTTERIDNFDLIDSNTGNFRVRDLMIDNPFVAGALLNKPYLRNTAGQIIPVPRPQTGGTPQIGGVPNENCTLTTPQVAGCDGFGFWADDDWVGLVIMSDLGAARVFDVDFNRTLGPVIRNMAGFTNSVSQELLTRRGGSAVVGWMQVIAGMFEPIALIDLDVADPAVDFLRRLESGPVEEFNFVGVPQNDDDVLREISSTYGSYDVDVRAVVVEDIAPSFIRDMNGDGRYTIADLRRMGYRPQSNEARLKLRVELDVLVTDTVTGRTCPPPSLIYRDLDGNGKDGAINCSGTGGAGRIRTVPR